MYYLQKLTIYLLPCKALPKTPLSIRASSNNAVPYAR